MRPSIKINEYALRNNPEYIYKANNTNQKPFYYYSHLQKYSNLNYRNTSSIQDLSENEKGSITIKNDKKQIKQIKSRIQSILKRNNQNMSPLLQTYYRSDIKSLGLIDKSIQSKTIQIMENSIKPSLLLSKQNSSSITSIRNVKQQDKTLERQNSCRAKLSKFYFKKNNPIKINRQYLLYNNIMMTKKSNQKLNSKRGTLSLPTDKYFKLQNYNQFGSRNYINLSSQKSIQKRKNNSNFNTTKLNQNFNETKDNIFQVQTFRQNTKKSLEIFKKILEKNMNSTKTLLNNNSSRLLDHNSNFSKQNRQKELGQYNQDQKEYVAQQKQGLNDNSSKHFKIYDNQNYYKTHRLNVKDQQLHTYYQKFYKSKQLSRHQIDKNPEIINKFRKVSQNHSFQKHQLQKQISRFQNQKNNDKNKSFQKTSQFFTCAGSSTLYPSNLKTKVDLSQSFKHKKIGYLTQHQQKFKIQNFQEHETTNKQKKSRRKLIYLKQPIQGDYESFDPWQRTKFYQQQMATIQIQQKS